MEGDQQNQQPQAGQTVQPGQQSVQSAPAPTPAPTPQPTPKPQSNLGGPKDVDDFFGDPADDFTPVEWEASEYIHHEKNMGWYVAFVVCIAVVTGILYWLLRDILFIFMSIIMAGAVIVYAGRKPRTLRYVLSGDGLSVGGNQYYFEQFKSFSVNQDGAIYSIVFNPIQRFSPALSIYFDEKDGDQILDILEEFVPREDRQPDVIDRFIKKIRF